jgi:hypothetical protein
MMRAAEFIALVVLVSFLASVALERTLEWIR